MIVWSISSIRRVTAVDFSRVRNEGWADYPDADLVMMLILIRASDQAQGGENKSW